MTAWATARTRGHLAVVDGFRGVVTAAFPRAVYVTPTRGDLLVVHHTDHGPTPTSLLVDVPLPASPGDLVVGRAHHLLLGDVVIDVRTAHVWSPPTAPRSGVMPRRRVRPTLTSTSISSMSSSMHFVRHPTRPECRPSCAGSWARHRSHTVGRRRHRRDPRSAPSLHVAGRRGRTARCAVGRPGACAGSDHADQRPLPEACARGEFGERLVSVVDACCTPSGPDPAAVDRLLATGATSGADALAGVTAAADLSRIEPTSVLEEVA